VALGESARKTGGGTVGSTCAREGSSLTTVTMIPTIMPAGTAKDERMIDVTCTVVENRQGACEQQDISAYRVSS
jgi:hypothetical protein